MTPYAGRSLDRAVLLMVSECFNIFSRDVLGHLGIDRFIVVPGNQTAPRGQQAYASVLPVSDEAIAQPFFYPQDDGSVHQILKRRAVYSIQFYREGSLWLARTFDAWAQSEDGLSYAQRTFSDGTIRYISVLNSGSGVPEDAQIQISGDGQEAVARPVVSRGAVLGVSILNHGHSYSLQPEITISQGDAEFTAFGSGFVIDFPLSLRRLDSIVSDMFEERVQIDMPVRYNLSQVQSSGYIDANAGQICLNGQNEIEIETDASS